MCSISPGRVTPNLARAPAPAPYMLEQGHEQD